MGALLPDVSISLSLHGGISQAVFTSFSPLTPVGYLPFDSSVDAGLWCWTRQTQSLFSWCFLFLDVTWAEALILVRKSSARVASCYSQILAESGETMKSALDLGEAGEGHNPRWIHHACKQSIHLCFLLILGSLLAFSFLCFYGPQAFIMSPSLLWETSNWLSNHSFF